MLFAYKEYILDRLNLLPDNDLLPDNIRIQIEKNSKQIIEIINLASSKWSKEEFQNYINKYHYFVKDVIDPIRTIMIEKFNELYPIPSVSEVVKNRIPRSLEVEANNSNLFLAEGSDSDDIKKHIAFLKSEEEFRKIPYQFSIEGGNNIMNLPNAIEDYENYKYIGNAKSTENPVSRSKLILAIANFTTSSITSLVAIGNKTMELISGNSTVNQNNDNSHNKNQDSNDDLWFIVKMVVPAVVCAIAVGALVKCYFFPSKKTYDAVNPNNPDKKEFELKDIKGSANLQVI